MLISINKLKGKGDLDDERLVMEAGMNLDVGDYAVFQTGYSNGGPTIKVHHAYWFPNKEVREGDLIILYTRAGSQHERRSEDGGTSHFYYWNKKSAIWDEPNTCPILLYAPDWSVYDQDIEDF